VRHFPRILAAALAVQAPATLDVSQVKIGAPVVVAEIDLGKLKGDLRQVAWSPDGALLYVQTADGDGPSAKTHHYVVPATGGALAAAEHPPDWAATYWDTKSARSAPGLDDVHIELVNGDAITGLPRDGRPGNGADIGQFAASNETRTSDVIVMRVFETTVGAFTNTRPVPGQTFSWGPEASGAIAFVDRDGRVTLLDRSKHRQALAGVKDATLPAWSTDGARLAWAQKTGRKKFALMAAALSR
jgi:hypothetical protein